MSELRHPADPAGREDQDPFDIVYRADMRTGAAVQAETHPLPDNARYHGKAQLKQVEEPEPRSERDKVDPKLREWLSARHGDEREQLVIVFADSLTIPRFPEPATDEPRSSSRNRALLERAQDVVRSIEEQRVPTYERLERDLAEYEARPVERFWIINGIVVDMPLKSVEPLARRHDVMSIEPRHSGEGPGQGNQVEDGRRIVLTDHMFDNGLGVNGGPIGILDTGVRASHTLLSNPSHIVSARDCVNGDAACLDPGPGTGFDPSDDSWNHGTSVAAILTGNGNQGNRSRGVTGITLDSFKIYPAGGGFLDNAAAVRSFQAAVAALDRVIVSTIQRQGVDHLSALSQAADKAFDAGAVVVSIVGNYGPNPSTVTAPGNARKVIGVGAYDVQTGAQTSDQGRGPTADGRYKPDIQTPTNTETASNASDTARHNLVRTSGAAPYAGGAAAMVRNWLRGSSAVIDPGYVYAHLILFGQNTYPFDNSSGAGALRLTTDGFGWWGKVQVSNGETVDCGFGLGAGGGATFPNVLDAAIWWPESSTHNDVDLHLVRPSSGSIQATSESVGGIWERCRVTGNVGGGWLLRITGYRVSSGPQTVYWAARMRWT
ncbi:S8 family serine peptidase [Streptomyces rishiriensis]|uniref:S8 family serine peptidase n=1 Tax=Streptomyces rishiriensis TaxID=68264 RepID=UPI003400C9B4